MTSACVVWTSAEPGRCCASLGIVVRITGTRPRCGLRGSFRVAGRLYCGKHAPAAQAEFYEGVLNNIAGMVSDLSYEEIEDASVACQAIGTAINAVMEGGIARVR